MRICHTHAKSFFVSDHEMERTLDWSVGFIFLNEAIKYTHLSPIKVMTFVLLESQSLIYRVNYLCTLFKLFLLFLD